MSANEQSAYVRFNEVAAASCASKVSTQLLNLNMAPNRKQWNRQGEQRRALWQELLELAQTQVAALDAGQEAPRRRARPKVAVVQPQEPEDTATPNV